MTSIAVQLLSPYLTIGYILFRIGIKNKQNRSLGCTLIFLFWLIAAAHDVSGVTFFNPTVGQTQTIYPSSIHMLFIILSAGLMLADLVHQRTWHAFGKRLNKP